MNRILIALSMVAAVAACETTEQSAALGGLTGAAIGAATAGEDETGGAILGAVVGATAGALIGNATQPGMCIYRYPDGTQYTAECPS
ncbi:YMGG-like glycine zipper-containing protein [Actibacterium sp. D379-3]